LANFGVAGTSAKDCVRLCEQLRTLHSSVADFKLGVVFWQQWFLWSHFHKPFHLWYWLLLLSQDSLHHNMPCIIYACLKNIYSNGYSDYSLLSSSVRGASGDASWVNCEMQLGDVNEQGWRCTSVLAGIYRTQWYTGRQRSRILRDIIEGLNWAISEMSLTPMIVAAQKLGSHACGDSLHGLDHVNPEI